MAYKTSHLAKLLVNSLNFKHGLLSQRVPSKFSRFLSSEGLKLIKIICFNKKKLIILAKTPETSTAASGPQILSKLFPQTAVSDEAEVKAEQEKQRQQEEG